MTENKKKIEIGTKEIRNWDKVVVVAISSVFFFDFFLSVCYFSSEVAVMYKNTFTLKKTQMYRCYFSYDYQDKRRLFLQILSEIHLFFEVM